jgi:arginine/lysine/ornithine decarboxylase
MSLYIHPENQRVLWTTINKVSGFSEKHDADIWFKQVIAHFYHQNSHRVLGKDDLLKLNKETIEYMIQQLRAPATAYVPRSMPSATSSVTSVASSVTSTVTSVTSLDPDTKMSTAEMNTLLQLRSLQDQIDELREEIRALRKPT